MSGTPASRSLDTPRRGRIPDEVLDQLRAIPTASVAEWLGLAKARERGKYACCWPSCDSSDALHAHPNHFKCYSCGQHGDAVALTQAKLGLDFRGAVEALASRFGILLPEAGPATRPRQRARKPVAPRTPRGTTPNPSPEPLDTPEDRTRRAAVYGRVLAVLTLTERGRAYLTERGLWWKGAEADGFRSVDGLTGWRQLYRVLRQDVPEDTLRLAGLWEAPPWQGKAPALVIPYTYRGEVVGLRFRHLDGGTPKYQSLRGLTLPLPFHADALDQLEGRTLHITEGELDAYTLRLAMPAGARVIGIPGATSWKAAWTPLLRPAARVVAWFDPDEGGQKGAASFAAKVQAQLGGTWLRERVAGRKVPEGEDVNSLWRKGLLTGDYLTD